MVKVKKNCPQCIKATIPARNPILALVEADLSFFAFNIPNYKKYNNYYYCYQYPSPTANKSIFRSWRLSCRTQWFIRPTNETYNSICHTFQNI